jgi:type II secretory pathway component PulM
MDIIAEVSALLLYLEAPQGREANSKKFGCLSFFLKRHPREREMHGKFLYFARIHYFALVKPLEDKEKIIQALQEARENLIKWTFTSSEERKIHENRIMDLQKKINLIEAHEKKKG